MSPLLIALLIVVLMAVLLLYFWFRSGRDRANSWVLRSGPSDPNRDDLAGSGVPRRPTPSFGGAQVELEEKTKEKTSVEKR